MTKLTAIIPVFRDAQRAIACAKSLLQLDQTNLDAYEVLIVDDGSGDDTPDIIEAGLLPGARLMRLPTNVGRARARNAGAAAAEGDTLLFIDCDCLPVGKNFLQAHLSQFEVGAVASTGEVVGSGSGFWHEFQVRSSARRAAMHAGGISYSGSTQNLAVKRNAFKAIGGFDEGYHAYGFEDRNLLLRLTALGTIAWADKAVVEHHDSLKLATVCLKMSEAGRSSAPMFRAQHPEAYKALGFSALDSTHHPARAQLARYLKPVFPVIIGLASTTLEWRWVPFSLRRFAVRGLSGISYLLGTAESNTDVND